MRKVLLLDKSLFIRIWIWSAVLCLIYYLMSSAFPAIRASEVIDLAMITYSVASLALYVMIFEFDWT